MRLRGFVCVVLILCLTASPTVCAGRSQAFNRPADSGTGLVATGDPFEITASQTGETRAENPAAGDAAGGVTAHPSEGKAPPTDDAVVDAIPPGEPVDDSPALPLPTLSSGLAPHVGKGAAALPDRQARSGPPRRLEELPALRTANSRHYLNSDGSITAEIYAGPVNYFDESEGWQEIDPTPRRRTDREGRLAGYDVDHSPVKLSLPLQANGPITVQAEDGRRVELTATDADAAPGSIDGSRVVYADAWPGVDLVEESRPEGLKETLVLKNANVADVYRFSLRLTGRGSRAGGRKGDIAADKPACGTVTAPLSTRMAFSSCPQRDRVLAGDPALDSIQATEGNGETLEEALELDQLGDGSWAIIDRASGEVLLALPAPYLEDSAGETAGAFLDLGFDQGRLEAVVTLDASWLSDPARVFPVRLDPSLNLLPAAQDTYTDIHNPTTNYSTSPFLEVEYVRDVGVSPAYVDWDISSIPPTAIVSSAYVVLRVEEINDGFTVAVAPAAEPWTASEVTWNEQPGHLDQSVSLRLNLDTVPRAWDIIGFFAQWVKGLSPYHGVAVFPVQDWPHTLPLTVRFGSSESPNAYARPRLDVTYSYGTDGAGLEGYWTTYSRDLGNGWSATVNLVTGNLVLQKTLYSIPGLGPTLGEGLVYNQVSRDTDRGLGSGWRFTSDMRLDEAADPARVEVTDEDGTVLWYVSDGAGGYTPPAGVFRKVEAAEGEVEVEVAPGEFAYFGADALKLTDKRQNDYRFDEGALTCIVDSNDHALAIWRDESDRIVKQRGSSGRELDYTYTTSEQGNEVTVTDPARDGDGNPTHIYRLTCDTAGDLVGVEAPDGSRVAFSYGEYGLASFTDARGMVTDFSYDSDGHPATIVGPYDPASPGPRPETTLATTLQPSLFTARVTTAVDAETETWTEYEIDPCTWNPLAATNAVGDRTTWTWEDNLKTAEVDAKGTSSWTYDVNGNVTEERRTCSGGTTGIGNSYSHLIHEYAYDENNNPIDFTNGNGLELEMKYDASSNLLSALNPNSQDVNGVMYDENMNPVGITPTTSGAPLNVPNPSFEHALTSGLPEGWNVTGTTADMEIVIDGPSAPGTLYGQHSLKLRNGIATDDVIVSTPLAYATVGEQTLPQTCT